MPPIALNEEQQQLKNEITELLFKCKDRKNEGKKVVQQWFDEMAVKAHELHMNLAEHGTEVKHHKYMIENRRLSADDPVFYRHIHPVEDLLAFIEDSSANDDPEDITIGDEFTFEVYTRRWGHEDLYRIKRTETGWYVGNLAINGECNKEGDPFLFRNLAQDFVNYPHKLGYYFEMLWSVAAEEGLTHDQVQEGLNQLASWVSLTERNRPMGIFDR